MKHATSFKNGDSVPRISTGKLMQENSKYLLPISVCAHHGLMLLNLSGNYRIIKLHCNQ